MRQTNDAVQWWSPKAAAAWQELAAEIDRLEAAERERDQMAQRYLAALMAALREGRPAPSMSEFEAYGRGGGDDPEFPQYDPGTGGTTDGPPPLDTPAPGWPPSAYAPVPGSAEYNRLAREGDASGQGVMVGAGVPGKPPGPIVVAPAVGGPRPVAVAPAMPSGYSPPHPLPTPDPAPTEPGYTPGPAPTLPGYTPHPYPTLPGHAPGPGYTPEPADGPGDFGATPVVGSGPYLNSAGAATAAPSPTPRAAGDAGNQDAGSSSGAGGAASPLWATPVETHAEAIAAIHNERGGATYAPRQGSLNGQPLYSVSIYPDRVDWVDGTQVTADALAAFMRRNEDLLQDPRLAVGTYYSPQNDRTYLDIVVPHPDEDFVAALSQKYDQESYYRLANGQVVETGGSGRNMDPQDLYYAPGRLDHEIERYRAGTF